MALRRRENAGGLPVGFSVGEGRGFLGDIEAVQIERGERIERRRGFSGDAEGIENMNLAETFTGAAGDLGTALITADRRYRCRCSP